MLLCEYDYDKVPMLVIKIEGIKEGVFYVASPVETLEVLLYDCMVLIKHFNLLIITIERSELPNLGN